VCLSVLVLFLHCCLQCRLGCSIACVIVIASHCVTLHIDYTRHLRLQKTTPRISHQSTCKTAHPHHHTHPHRNAPRRTAKNETQIEVFVDFFKIRSKIVVKLPIPGLSPDSPCITAPLTPPAHPTGDPRPVTVKYGPPGSQSVLSGLWQPAVLRCVLPAPFQLCGSQR
jgi:hypothetical protein